MKPGYFRDFAKYTSLNVLGMIGLSCYILADTFFISKGLGANGLTALNLAIPVYNFIHGTGLMIGIGGGTGYSIHKSRGEDGDANRVFTTALMMVGSFAVLFILTGLFLTEEITTLLGADQTVFQMTQTYIRVLLIASPFFMMNNLLLAFIRNDGAPGLAMAGMIGGSLSNVLLDWIFIFPLGMGIFGAVFATCLAPIISMTILSPYFFRRKNQFKPVRTLPKLRRIAGIAGSGAPSLVTEVSSGVVMIVFNTIILYLNGNIGVAAYGVIANLAMVVLAVYTGIAQGIQPLMSRYFGLGDPKGSVRTLRYALTLVAIFSVLVYGVVFFFASPIAGIFNSEGSALLQQIATEGLKLYFIGCPFAGVNIILPIYFTSSELPRPAGAISLLRGFFVIIPMALLLGYWFELPGIWCSFPVTELLVMLAAFGMFILCRKKA